MRVCLKINYAEDIKIFKLIYLHLHSSFMRDYISSSNASIIERYFLCPQRFHFTCLYNTVDLIDNIKIARQPYSSFGFMTDQFESFDNKSY